MAKVRRSSFGWYRLAVKVQPSAARSAIMASVSGGLKVRIAAPAVDNRANDMLIGLLAESLGVGRSSVVILRGQASRNKLIGINCPGDFIEAWLLQVKATARRLPTREDSG